MTLDNGTDGQTDRQTECDAIWGPLLGRRAACDKLLYFAVIYYIVKFQLIFHTCKNSHQPNVRASAFVSQKFLPQPTEPGAWSIV